MSFGRANPMEPTPPQPGDIAVIMYTSGTTGTSWGAGKWGRQGHQVRIWHHSHVERAMGALPQPGNTCTRLALQVRNGGGRVGEGGR